VQVEKAYILRTDHPRSREYSHECGESCIRQGIKFDYYEGIVPGQGDPASIIFYKNHTLNQGEIYATASHWSLWQKIARGTQTAAIVEHDVLFVRGLRDVSVEDDEVLFLGYRVVSRKDYRWPGGEVKKVETQEFRGAHAYALTPLGAKRLLDAVYGGTMRHAVDEFLGTDNRARMKLMVVDPPICVCEVGEGRLSTVTNSLVSATESFLPHPGFFAGFSHPEKYYVDGGVGCLKAK
jgi:GR25 family glycosyltransferase involved in LPS biosynthesis